MRYASKHRAKIRRFRFVLTGVLLVYFNLVMANIVSLRQYWYVQTFRNGTEMEPLYDTLFMDWIGPSGIQPPASMTARDMVDVSTYTWIGTTIIAWLLTGQEPILAARALTAQLLFIPMFTGAQLLTIVPDATPFCLEKFQIPSETEIDWIFTRYPRRTCGNMLWSSDIALMVVFTSISTAMVSASRTHLKRFVWLVGEFWTVMTMLFIFTAQYQYSVDVFSTIIVVKLAMSHQALDTFAASLFLENYDYYDKFIEIVPVTI
jgi:hypothetical protein